MQPWSEHSCIFPYILIYIYTDDVESNIVSDLLRCSFIKKKNPSLVLFYWLCCSRSVQPYAAFDWAAESGVRSVMGQMWIEALLLAANGACNKSEPSLGQVRYPLSFPEPGKEKDSFLLIHLQMLNFSSGSWGGRGREGVKETSWTAHKVHQRHLRSPQS